jgi:hypothetical protein
MPEDIGGKPARILRIGLGALTARQAKLQAEMLAALARNRFEQIRMARMSEHNRETMAGTDGDQAEVTAAEVKGYLKAMHHILSQPAPPTPPHQEPAFEGMRGLVLLNRELTKGASANPLIAKNAEVLKTESIAGIDPTIAILDGVRPFDLPSPAREAGEAAASASSKQAASALAVPADDEAMAAVIPAAERPAPVLTPPEPLPSAHAREGPRVNETAIDERLLKGPDEEASSGESDSTFGFAVPASSTPAGPDSEIRIYRDENGKIIPAHRLDRRSVARKASSLPRLSEVAEEYFDARAIKVGADNKHLKTARNRLNIFIELIGDHPIDSYSGADLQAYIALMTHWPANERHRPAHMTPWEILASNSDLRFKPLKRAAFENGYVSIAKTVIGTKATDYQYENPLAGIKLRYPDTAAPAQSAEPLSHEQLNNVFRAGIAGGLLDEAMLPLLGNLTG